MHYFKRNIGDYHKKAGRLSMLEHGAYTLLMDACYDREQFPTLEQAYDWCWAKTDEEKAAIWFVLSKFFTEQEGVYYQTRIQEEIDKYHSNSSTNARIAREREERKRTNRARTVHERAPNQEPKEPINQRTIETKEPKQHATELPDWLPTDLWKDYLQARKALKAPMTERAKQLAIKKLDELMKQGYPPKDVLSQSIYNGWKGLFPLKTEKESWHDKRARAAKELIYGKPKDERVIDGEAEIVDWPPI